MVRVFGGVSLGDSLSEVRPKCHGESTGVSQVLGLCTLAAMFNGTPLLASSTVQEVLDQIERGEANRPPDAPARS